MASITVSFNGLSSNMANEFLAGESPHTTLRRLRKIINGLNVGSPAVADGTGTAMGFVMSASTASAVNASATATLATSLAAAEKVTLNGGATDFVCAKKYATNIVTCASVQAADTVTVGGTVFTAVNGGTPTSVQFDMSGSDTATGAALAAAITAKIPSVTAVNASGAVTITATTAGATGNNITLATSNGSRLAITTAGGKLAGAYDFTANTWSVGASLTEAAASLAACINASTTSGVAGIYSASSSGAVVTIRACSPGKHGNVLTLARTGSHITVSGSTLSNGAGCDGPVIASASAL